LGWDIFGNAVMFLLERQFVLAFWGNAESSFCFSWAFSILLLYSFVAPAGLCVWDMIYYVYVVLSI